MTAMCNWDYDFVDFELYLSNLTFQKRLGIRGEIEILAAIFH